MLHLKREKDNFEVLLKSIMYNKLLDNSNRGKYYSLDLHDRIRQVINHIPVKNGPLAPTNHITNQDIADLIQYQYVPKDQNIAIGMRAMCDNTTGTYSTGIGYQALNTNKYKNKLKASRQDNYSYWYFHHDLIQFNIYCDIEGLFCFAYYLNYHHKEDFKHIKKVIHHLHCKDTMNGYTLISPIILSKANIALKKYFINEISLTPTDKDIALANYVLYENLLTLPNILYQFDLIHDINRYIMQLLIHIGIKHYKLI